ncbi:hypothetical protein WN944_023080 [Citrus x changshan-huyou]|uniref:Uncharacterized protein n=1 Tax=Citrus x changshan-huyou TaxID=2935761 RepID=A0AAP0R1R9_9ROSI
MKHVAIDFHFIRDQVQHGALRVTHVSSTDQIAYALTMPLPRARFHHLKKSLEEEDEALVRSIFQKSVIRRISYKDVDDDDKDFQFASSESSFKKRKLSGQVTRMPKLPPKSSSITQIQVIKKPAPRSRSVTTTPVRSRSVTTTLVRSRTVTNNLPGYDSGLIYT